MFFCTSILSALNINVCMCVHRIPTTAQCSHSFIHSSVLKGCVVIVMVVCCCYFCCYCIGLRNLSHIYYMCVSVMSAAMFT